MASEDNDMYKEKYLKYKQKYLELKKQEGGLVYLSSGEYLFFYNSEDVSDKTPLLKNLEDNEGKLVNAKPDLTKIGNEISNNGFGYYFQKGTKKAILFKSFAKKMLKSTKNIYKAVVGKTINPSTLPHEIRLDTVFRENKVHPNQLHQIKDIIKAELEKEQITVNRVIQGTVGLTGHKIDNFYKY
jgi:hypothetical protein